MSIKQKYVKHITFHFILEDSRLQGNDLHLEHLDIGVFHEIDTNMSGTISMEIRSYPFITPTSKNKEECYTDMHQP